MQTVSIKKILTTRYLIALSLIAVLSTAAYYILHFAIKASETTVLVVNMAGKQRMLSQRIASISQQYYDVKYEGKDGNISKLQNELENAVLQMRHANLALSSGNLEKRKHAELSPHLHAIYFGDTRLYDRVETYLALSESLLNSKNSIDSGRYLNKLLAFSDPLLVDLDSTVKRYQIEGEEKILRIHTFAAIAWILILISLVFEIQLIFRPMAIKINELFNEVEDHQLYLEKQILQRTLKLEKSNMKLQHLASHDPLTGLKNRLNLEKNLETFIHQYQQDHIPYSVVMFDIDWFKTINDTYGHEAGDFILCEVAAILLNHTRDEDSVHRSGGEEFVLLLTKITFEQAVDKADAIRLAVTQHPFLYDDNPIHVTLSGGVYHPDVVNSKKIQEIMKLTDAALYEAKRSGRNRVLPVSQPE